MASITVSRHLFTFTTALGISLFSSAGWAARDFTPQSGTWVISAELNGQPGRGLGIDVQGNTFAMQMFGYEKNGDATFYTAVGQMQGNTVSAPLVRYTGGRSFGSEPRDAQEDKVLGDVKLSFSNGLQGTLQLPGEPEVAIERYDFTGRDSPYYQSERWMRAKRYAVWLALNEQGQVVADWKAELQWGLQDPMPLILRKGALTNTLECTRPAHKETIRCEAVDATQAPSVQAAEFRMVGSQTAGSISLREGAVAPLLLQGVNTRTDFPYRGAIQTGCCINGLESFSSNFPGVYYGSSPVYMPSNGVWIVQDELTGKPGRGISLDAQGDLLTMQVFAYQANGQPTFFMGVGGYQQESERSYTSTATLVLNQYKGGRSVGGAPAIAELAQSAGEVRVSVLGGFDRSLALAQVQFPGEALKTMQRLPMELPQSTAEKLFGEWYFSWFQANGMPITTTLNRMDGDMAANEDGSVKCRYSAEAEEFNCLRSTSPSNTSRFKSPDDFFLSSDYFRVRDRHGNWMGLGNIPLD